MEMIRFNCTCGKSLEAAEEQRGEKAKCPVCGKEMVVPISAPKSHDAPAHANMAPHALGKATHAAAESHGSHAPQGGDPAAVLPICLGPREVKLTRRWYRVPGGKVNPVEVVVRTQVEEADPEPPLLPDVSLALRAKAWELGANAVLQVEYWRSKPPFPLWLMRAIPSVFRGFQFMRARGLAVSADPSMFQSIPNDAEDKWNAIEQGKIALHVSLHSGEIRDFETANELREQILAGGIPQESPCRRASKYGYQWKPLRKIASRFPELVPLYRPVWAHALRGLYLGIALTAIIQGVLLLPPLFRISPILGGLFTLTPVLLLSGAAARSWPLILGSVFAPFSITPVLRLLFGLRESGVLQIPKFPDVLFFLIALSAGVLALALTVGAPLCMVIGTIVGHCRRSKARLAPDAAPEGSRPYWLGIGLATLVLCAGIVMQILGMSWVRHWPK
jgi:hypothetical protein